MVEQVVRELLQNFAGENNIGIYLKSHHECPYFFFDSSSSEVQHAGALPGPTWLVFAVAGNDMDRDLMVREEILIGEVKTSKELARSMLRNYSNTGPFYGVRSIENRPFLFMIQDLLFPLAVGQESLEARVMMELIINVMSHDIEGIEIGPAATKFAVERHVPRFWPSRVEYIMVSD